MHKLRKHNKYIIVVNDYNDLDCHIVNNFYFNNSCSVYILKRYCC